MLLHDHCRQAVQCVVASKFPKHADLNLTVRSSPCVVGRTLSEVLLSKNAIASS